MACVGLCWGGCGVWVGVGVVKCVGRVWGCGMCVGACVVCGGVGG